MNSPTERRNEIARVLKQRFGDAPTLWVRAPGRVDLMGSHTDYNLGFVLTLPIDLDTDKSRTSAFIESAFHGYFERTHLHPDIIPVTAAAGAGLLMDL